MKIKLFQKMALAAVAIGLAGCGYTLREPCTGKEVPSSYRYSNSSWEKYAWESAEQYSKSSKKEPTLCALLSDKATSDLMDAKADSESRFNKMLEDGDREQIDSLKRRGITPVQVVR